MQSLELKDMIPEGLTDSFVVVQEDRRSGIISVFVSLEDNLMRRFGSDRIAKIMDRMGYKEGEVIQHRMITKSIERAQKK